MTRNEKVNFSSKQAVVVITVTLWGDDPPSGGDSDQRGLTQGDTTWHLIYPLPQIKKERLFFRKIYTRASVFLSKRRCGLNGSSFLLFLFVFAHPCRRDFACLCGAWKGDYPATIKDREDGRWEKLIRSGGLGTSVFNGDDIMYRVLMWPDTCR